VTVRWLMEQPGGGCHGLLDREDGLDGAGVAALGLPPAGLAGQLAGRPCLPLGLIKSRMRRPLVMADSSAVALAAIDSFLGGIEHVAALQAQVPGTAHKF